MGVPEASEVELWGFSLVVEGACDNSDLAMLNFFITLSPSPSFVGSSLPEGAFVTASERKTEGQIKNILSDVSEGAV